MLRPRYKVKDIMTRDLTTCLKTTSLVNVSYMMLYTDCGAIPVVDSKQNMYPIGIITDRDIVCRTVARGINPLNETVQNFMSGECITINQSQNSSDCMKLMMKKKIRRIIVVDDDNRCVGIVCLADIALNGSKRDTCKLIQEVSRPFGYNDSMVA